MWSSQRGLAEKLIINGEFRPETTRCSKCDHLLHNGSVRLDFMTDDVNEAEEMRIQTVVSDCAAEIRNLNESGWVAVRRGCWQTRLMEVPEAAARAMFLEDFEGRVLPFDMDAAIAYADIFAARRRAGRPTATVDLIVASVARSANASVVTRGDVSGFEGCGLTVINPWDAT